jgi:hypothetical protein
MPAEHKEIALQVQCSPFIRATCTGAALNARLLTSLDSQNAKFNLLFYHCNARHGNSHAGPYLRPSCPEKSSGLVVLPL